MKRTGLKKGFLTSLALFCMSLAGLASAALVGVPIDNTGWYVSLDNPSSIGTVDFVYDGVDDNNIRLELVKEFNSPFGNSNQGDGLWIKFTLVDPCAPNFRPNIVIWDERVINNTDRAWTDFHIILGTRIPTTGESGSPIVGFDPGNIFTPTANNPFSSIAFDPCNYTGLSMDGGQTNTPIKLDMADGVFPNGGEQRIFGGANGGHLRIVTDMTSGQYFWLKEFPTVPEPATLSLLALGALPLIRKRRSN